MSRFDLNDDHELGALLKKYAPIAPKAPEGELDLIIKKINEDKKQKDRRWAITSGALAASFATFMLLTHFQMNEVAPRNEIVWEDDSDFFGKELPTNNIGELYLTLVSMSDLTE